MRKKTASLAAVLAVVVVTSGCDNGDGNGFLEPAPFSGPGGAPVGSRAFGVDTSTIRVQSLGQFACPALPPFLGGFDLFVRAPGDLSVSLQSVRMTFIDSTGLQAPSVTLPAPALTRQFGTTLVQARADRAFSLTFPFGCRTRRAGTLVVIVVATDQNGDEQTAEVRAAVR